MTPEQLAAAEAKKAADAKLEAEKQNQVPDYQTALKAKDDELARIRKERDDYRNMGLKYKKAAKESGGTDDEDVEEKIRRISREEFLATQEFQIVKEKDEYISKMSSELREAKLALLNKPTNTSTGAGSSQEDRPIPDNFFSDEQLAGIDRHIATMQRQGIKVDREQFMKDLKSKSGQGIVYKK
jgi:hypothetical protein